MQQILSETTIALGQAAKLIPGRPNYSTLFRWATRGVRGTRLETVAAGARRFTSEQAVVRFLEACNAAAALDADGELETDGL